MEFGTENFFSLKIARLVEFCFLMSHCISALLKFVELKSQKNLVHEIKYRTIMHMGFSQYA
jgi:hypothetical protein